MDEIPDLSRISKIKLKRISRFYTGQFHDRMVSNKTLSEYHGTYGHVLLMKSLEILRDRGYYLDILEEEVSPAFEQMLTRIKYLPKIKGEE